MFSMELYAKQSMLKLRGSYVFWQPTVVAIAPKRIGQY